jgi:hypothetical protein
MKIRYHHPVRELDEMLIFHPKHQMKMEYPFRQSAPPMADVARDFFKGHVRCLFGAHHQLSVEAAIASMIGN